MRDVYIITDWTGFSLMVNDRVAITSPSVCLPVGKVFRVKYLIDNNGEDIILDTKPHGIYNNTDGDWPVSYRDIVLVKRPWYNKILKRLI